MAEPMPLRSRAALAGAAPCLVVGHANGYVTVWRQGLDPTRWTLASATDVRAAKLVNPLGLHDIRTVANIQVGDGQGHAVTGSEDGNLTVLRLANRAVGPGDSNPWRHEVDPADWSITLTDKAIPRIDPSAAQVFNFDVIFAALACGPTSFFRSTEEGALWMGQIEAGATLSIAGYQPIGAALGSALFAGGVRLAATAYDLHEYPIA